MRKFTIYIKSILIPLLLGSVVGFIVSGYMDYNSLKQPIFAPPAILFPIVWTILYTLMGLSFGILKSKNLVIGNTSTIYYLQLFVNLLWSFIFFVFKMRLLAFIWILLLIVLVVSMIIDFYIKNKAAGLIQIPYLLWLIFAAILNLSVYFLNK